MYSGDDDETHNIVRMVLSDPENGYDDEEIDEILENGSYDVLDHVYNTEQLGQAMLDLFGVDDDMLQDLVASSGSDMVFAAPCATFDAEALGLMYETGSMYPAQVCYGKNGYAVILY